MEHVQPFTFERVFAPNSKAAGGSVVDLQMRLAALEAQVEAADQLLDGKVAQARADGFTAGLAQARSETIAATRAAADAIVQQLQMVSQQFAETETRIRDTATEVALAAAELLAGRALAAAPAAAVDAAIGRVLAQVGHRQSLTVTVHPSLVAPLEELVAGHRRSAGTGLALAIEEDPQTPPGDAQIRWDQGGLELDAADRRRAIRAELGLALPE